MKNKRRLILGSVFFALLFFYLGLRIYFVFIYAGSYDGWTATRKANDTHPYIVAIDPKGPATALQINDEFLAINGLTLAEDPNILNYYQRVAPGTPYRMAIRREGQEMVIPLVTSVQMQRRTNFYEQADIFINAIFLVTALLVFLLKPDNNQAWLLALVLGTFIGLNNWNMPLERFGRGLEILVAGIKIMCLWCLPWLLRFFLDFPTRSPILQRWPKLLRYLNWPFYLLVLPFLGGSRLSPWLSRQFFGLPFISWLDAHFWFRLPLAISVAYLLAALTCLLVNYRVANQNDRRRLRVVLGGSGTGLLILVLVVLVENIGLKARFPNLMKGLEFARVFTTPLIPLSFAYAIIRHKVIPISLIIRRGVRYLLVSRGAVILEFLTVILVLTVVLRTIMMYFQASHLVVGLVSGIVSVAVWQTTRAIHNRYLAPLINRKFFRQSYDAQQIMSELSESLRATTDRAQLPELVATKIQAALQTERVTILLKDEASGAFTCAYSCDYDPRSSHSTASVNGHQFTSQTELTNRLRVSADALEVDWEGETARVENVETLSDAETTTLRALNSALLLPLKGKDEMSGIISLGARLGDLPFSNEDKRLLLSVSAPMSFALENTRLIERMIEDARRREELEAENEAHAKELEEARQLQLSMLPKKVPQFPNLEIAAYMKTATEVGGDYYDFHVAADGTLTIAIGDATGHGLKAGTVVTATKSLFHELANGDDLPDMLKRFSYALKQMNMRSLFMALTVVRLRNHGLTITVAGMPPILIYRATQRHIEEIFIKAMPLGCLTNYTYKQEDVALQPGDIVVLMSDGFPERFNEANEMLGYDQAKDTLIATAHLSSQEILTRLVQAGDDWGQSRLADDDITFVVLKIR